MMTDQELVRGLRDGFAAQERFRGTAAEHRPRIDESSWRCSGPRNSARVTNGRKNSARDRLIDELSQDAIRPTPDAAPTARAAGGHPPPRRRTGRKGLVRTTLVYPGAAHGSTMADTTLVHADRRGERARDALRADTEWAAPEHWRAEVFSAIRGLRLGGKLAEPPAERAIERIGQLTIDTVPLEALLPGMWSLRHAINGYDAAYVALAWTPGLTLVTGDERRSGEAARHCPVRVV